MASREAQHRAWYNYRRSVGGRYSVVKRKCKMRGRLFRISKRLFAKLNAMPCNYCGGPLPIAGCGLDRVNHKQGYTKKNVVSCCQSCNTRKGYLEGAGLPLKVILWLMRKYVKRMRP